MSEFYKPQVEETLSESIGPVVRLKDNKENVIRLHQVTCYINQDNKTKVGDYRSQKYRAPKGLCKFDICKVLSYICDLVERDAQVEHNNIRGTLVVETLLQTFDFEQLESYDATPCSDFYLIWDELDVFAQTKFAPKAFRWYVEGVTKEDIKNIYKRRGLKTDIIDEIDVEFVNEEHTV